MKNSYNIALIICCLTLMFGCKKDIVGNPITVEVYSNVPPTNYFGIYNSCQPGPGGYPDFAPDSIQEVGNGNYSYQIDAGYSAKQCFTIGGTIPENTDTTKRTIIRINAFYTEEGNTVGYQEIILERPHGQYAIRYQFDVSTYLD